MILCDPLAPLRIAGSIPAASVSILDAVTTLDDLPPFDVKSKCVKCGYVIPDPVAPEPKLGPKGAEGTQKTLPAPPPEPRQPPTVEYCSGDECTWKDAESDDDIDEHMHQFCDVCGYEWLSKPLDA